MLQLGASGLLKAQIDPHFSQYYANPLWLNPALTGVIDGDIRINANVRDQWTGISNGYKTGALSMDFRPTEKVGLGLSFLNLAAGTAGYNYFTAGVSFSYSIPISTDGNKKVHFGVEAGVINRSFDPSKLQLDDQYNPITGYDPNMPSFETFSTTNSVVFDSSAGIFYDDSDPDSKVTLFGGLSAAHLTAEKDPFAAAGIKSILPIRLTIHGGLKIKASDFLELTPHVIYIKQQANQITAFGVYSKLKFQDNNGLIVGGMYRVNDAAVADVGYQIDSMVIGVSYDFNTSALHAATAGQGGLELSLRLVFQKSSRSSSSNIPGF